jgi:hypothetical protein
MLIGGRIDSAANIQGSAIQSHAHCAGRSVDSSAIGEYMCEGAFCTEFAVALHALSVCSDRPFVILVPQTFAKYLQGAVSIVASVEWRKGHADPA